MTVIYVSLTDETIRQLWEVKPASVPLEQYLAMLVREGINRKTANVDGELLTQAKPA